MKTIISTLFVLTAFVSVAKAQTCAVAFQGPWFQGPSLSVQAGDKIANLGAYQMTPYESWNNQPSSVWVAPRCHLTVFQYNNWGRDYTTGAAIGTYASYYEGNYGSMGYMDKLTSSLICHCY